MQQVKKVLNFRGMPILLVMKPLRFLALILVLFTALVPSAMAESGGIGQIFTGVAKTLYAVVQIPANMIAGGAQSFPLGIVTGAVAGTFKMVAGTVMGASDIAQGAAPYAKYAALAL